MFNKIPQFFFQKYIPLDMLKNYSEVNLSFSFSYVRW